MKIKEVSIIKLHNHFNYQNIKFNNDVTFLYGMNGSGKTTVLNILENIISGQIYKLFNYQFKKIVVTYGSNDEDNYKIKVNLQDNSINLEMDEKIFSIEHKSDFNSNFSNINETSYRHNKELAEFYFEEYPILKKIKHTFNHVYLPLHRNSNEELSIGDERFFIE